MQKPQKFPPPAVGNPAGGSNTVYSYYTQNRAEGANIFGDFDFKLKPPFILKPPPCLSQILTRALRLTETIHLMSLTGTWWESDMILPMQHL